MTKSRQKGPLKKNYKDQQIIEPWEISHKQSEIVLQILSFILTQISILTRSGIILEIKGSAQFLLSPLFGSLLQNSAINFSKHHFHIILFRDSTTLALPLSNLTFLSSKQNGKTTTTYVTKYTFKSTRTQSDNQVPQQHTKLQKIN